MIELRVRSHIISFLVHCSEENGPCMLVVYRMAYYHTAGLSRCVPMNARFLRDTVQEMVYEDVNQTEEYEIVTIALVGLEIAVGAIFGIAYCIKARSDDGIVHTRDPRDAFEARLE